MNRRNALGAIGAFLAAPTVPAATPWQSFILSEADVLRARAKRAAEMGLIQQFEGNTSCWVVRWGPNTTVQFGERLA